MYPTLASVGLVPPVCGAAKTQGQLSVLWRQPATATSPVKILTVAWSMFCKKGQWAGGQG